MMKTTRCLCILVTLLAFAGTLYAQAPPEKNISFKQFQHPGLTAEESFQNVQAMPLKARADVDARLRAMGLENVGAILDARTGRFATLMPSTPLIDGPGVGNNLPALKAGGDRGQAAWAALRSYLQANEAAFGVDVDELTDAPTITVYDDNMIHVHAQRQIDGVAVRDSYVKGTVRFGNLILVGAQKWDTNRGASAADFVLSRDQAESIADGAVGGRSVTKADRTFLTMLSGAAAQSFRYVAAYAVTRDVPGDAGRYEVLVDAKTGDVLSIIDTNQYGEVKGGVLPVTNDGIVPDGVEQAGWPMPFADVGAETTSTGGNFSAGGTVSTDFYGPYVNINDNCGTSSLSGSGTLDWGTSGGTDCTTPGFGGAGNTHASRTGFYELNKVIEMGRGQLPGNTWLTQRLTSNMNINNTCNAYWNGTVNFYRSGGGCSNTGEIAGVFDHEWGHGMDANDATPGIASPSGEGIADIYTALRLNDSCIGRNFQGTVCSGNGDPCDTCTGVRDIDYLKRQSNNPHTYTWSNATCGGSVHCVGGTYSEAVWSLWKRELPGTYGYDNNTAHEITTRLTYIGAGNTGTWFSGGPPNGGCAASSGYMNYLAADDDNGNLNDGTPHMVAIHKSFNDQEIACQTPTVQNGGCAGGPTAAPSVTAISADTGVNLSWTSVANATEYEVFRTEGVFACDFGKVKVATTAGTTFNDSGLQNGRDYSYIVIAKGAADSCFGAASACTTQQPGKIPCGVDADCTDGLYCNGAESCVAGFCENGTDPCAANPTWTCDDNADVCVPECTVDADCSDGLYCNGAEVCNAGTCEAGGDPCPGQCCDEGTTSCGLSNDPQNAVYDAGLGAPACACGSSCDSQSLLDGRGSVGPESNAPNTVDACTDGNTGSYHGDESNDRIVVTNLSGTGFQEGDTVEVAATVWAWNTGSSDSADFYYAADANNPSWTFIGSVTPPAGGAQTLTQQYVLPAGSLQAVRVNFRYSGSVSSCSGGSYDDADDLVFSVASGGGGCTVDADCDNGVYCDGAETCNAGTCQSGAAVSCDDGVSCTDDACVEGTQSCSNTVNDANCDNGAWCDGAETCDAVLDCQAGTAPNCDDGVGCTVDTCNEGADACDNTPNDAACDNGAFCDGAETCDAGLDCQAGTPPSCTFGCDEAGDSCFECSVDADCDDGAFCNGAETCNAGSCAAGSDPCPGATCDEAGDVCVTCAPSGSSCTANGECCSGNCKGKTGNKTCK